MGFNNHSPLVVCLFVMEILFTVHLVVELLVVDERQPGTVQCTGYYLTIPVSSATVER